MAVSLPQVVKLLVLRTESARVLEANAVAKAKSRFGPQLGAVRVILLCCKKKVVVKKNSLFVVLSGIEIVPQSRVMVGISKVYTF